MEPRSRRSVRRVFGDCGLRPNLPFRDSYNRDVMRHLKPTALAVFGLLAVGAFARQDHDLIKAGDKAPDFSVVGTDGKTHTIASLTKDGPVFLYFVKQNCGANPLAVPLFNQLYGAYGKKAQFVGVMDADKGGFDDWKSTFKGQFVTLLDKNEKIIHGYGVAFSQTTVMIGKDGKVAKVFPGFGKESMSSLNASLAGAAKVGVQNVDLSNAPTRPRFG